MFKGKLVLAAVSGVLAASFAFKANAAEYDIDKAHTKIGFTVTHMMLSEVEGQFKDFDGTFAFDATKGAIIGKPEFTVKAKSIDTANEKRDEHLKSADFFDVAKYPNITLKNSKITKTGEGKFDWTADLTIKDKTHPVKFALNYKGTVKDPWGSQRAGFVATGAISRKEFGLTWNKALESGGVVVGDEVTIKLSVEATEKGAAAAAAPAPKKK